MAFNPIEYLKNGNVGFVFRLTPYDKDDIITRIKKSSNRKNIIFGCLYKLIDLYPTFCFELIYDMDDYTDELFYLLEKYKGYIIFHEQVDKIKNILYNTTFGEKHVMMNIDDIINSNPKNLYVILDYIFSSFENNQDLLKQLYLYPNLHIRALIMKYIIENHKDKLNLIYDDIMKYLTSYTYREYEQLTFLPELMSIDDISELAEAVFKSNYKDLWEKFKYYILTNYKTNNLAEILLKQKAFEEFVSDSDELFRTSNRYQFEIYQRYSKYIAKDILEHFKSYIDMFKINGKYDIKLQNIFYYGLGHELIYYIDKYLSQSKDTTYEFIQAGTTAACFRIGDYAFKLNYTKWSYEDVICPNIYLILKNLEEHYVRDKNGVVLAGIEVQKFLKRKATDIPNEIFTKFRNELSRLGYYSADRFVGGKFGDNCMLLATYKDADSPNPEYLPDWFKEIPLVLIDRDRIYQLENEHPKQLVERLS